MKKLYFLFFTVANCFNLFAQDLSKTMTITAGTGVSVISNATLNADEVNLKSTSSEFSSLLLDGGTVGTSTIINYDRYVNVVGSSSAGGNDLISLPLKNAGNVTFAEFLTYSEDGIDTNADIITNSTITPSLYAFGPYDNGAQSYINFDSDLDGAEVLKIAKGYRAATDGGETVRFTGESSVSSEPIEITTNATSNSYWNVVGNPYPTYVDSQAFLTENAAVLDPVRNAIYGYNSGNSSPGSNFGKFSVINMLSNTDLNIAPGQGFVVANDRETATNELTFTPAMRTFTGTDDFITGRNSQNIMLRLKAESGSNNFATEVYFNDASTLGLDPGYDAGLFFINDNDFKLYSQLVDNNEGENMVIQSLGSNNLDDVVIPLGLNTAQGQQVTFSIETSTLPTSTLVYLEDNQTNTFTLLNNGNYSFTPNTVISGTGRFFLRIGNSSLSTSIEESNSLQLFASDKTLFIKGQLLADTTITVYDIQGRLVLNSNLEAGSVSNKIDANVLSQGVYVVKLKNKQQEQTKKVVIK